MGKISNAVGKMPFAGKSLVENRTLEAICERTSLQEKTSKSIRAAGFLVIFAAVHGIQAKLGTSDLSHDLGELQDGVSATDAAEVCISGLYTLANAAVTYTQAQLGYRVGRNYLHFRSQYRHAEEFPAEDYQYEPRIPTANQVAFTSAGQALFLAQFDGI